MEEKTVMEEFYRKELCAMLQGIRPPEEAAMLAARAHWDHLAKPIGGLGKLEDLIVQIAGIAHTEDVRTDKKALVVFCADNGVVAEGVSQTDAGVTAVVTDNFARGLTSANVMAALADVDVLPVDIGVAGEITEPGVMDCKVAPGTGDIMKKPAMTEEQALEALLTGIRLAGQMKDMGYQILAAGEMGIGNTTTSAAVVSVMLSRTPREVTGRGAGLPQEGLARKCRVIERAVALHHPDRQDPLAVLASLGGFDIAGICGLFLGGAIYGLPVVMDGLVSAAAALVAVKLCPAVRDYLIPSHVGREPACRLALAELGMEPVIHADLALGEGTGALLLMALLTMAEAVYRKDATFEDIALTPYERFED